MNATLPKDPKFVSEETYSNLLWTIAEEVREELGVSPSDKEAYKKALIERADHYGIGFAFTFFFTQKAYIDEHFGKDKDRICEDYQTVNSRHGMIRTAVSRALNDYVLSHDGVIDSWPEPDGFVLFKTYKRTSQYDDSYKYDSENFLEFVYSYFAPDYTMVSQDTVKTEQRFSDGIERTQTTYRVLGRTSENHQNHSSFTYIKNPALVVLNRMRDNAETTISYHKKHVRSAKWNRFKSGIAWIPALWLLFGALSLLFWVLTGKQQASELVVLQTIMQTIMNAELSDIWDILLMIPLLPILICLTVWHLALLLPSPFSTIVCVVAAAVVVLLACGLKMKLNEKLDVEKEEHSIKELKKQYQDAQATLSKINNSPEYARLLEEDQKAQEFGKTLFSQWSNQWFEDYKELILLRSTNWDEYNKRFKRFSN